MTLAIIATLRLRVLFHLRRVRWRRGRRTLRDLDAATVALEDAIDRWEAES